MCSVHLCDYSSTESSPTISRKHRLLRIVLLDLMWIGSVDLVERCVWPDGRADPRVATLFGEVVADHLLRELIERRQGVELVNLNQTMGEG